MKLESFVQDNTAAISSVIARIEVEYDLQIYDQTARCLPRSVSHPGVRFYQIPKETPEIRSVLRSELRQQLNAIGWQYSEYTNSHFAVVAPMQCVAVPIAYHATRTANVPTIMEEGLLPSTSDISTTGRPDCYGHIYVCEKLGNYPGSPDIEPEKGTAVWWKWKLRRENRCNDHNWTILLIRLEGLSSRVYRDIWSTSGLIIDERISPERLAIVDSKVSIAQNSVNMAGLCSIAKGIS